MLMSDAVSLSGFEVSSLKEVSSLDPSASIIGAGMNAVPGSDTVSSHATSTTTTATTTASAETSTSNSADASPAAPASSATSPVAEGTAAVTTHSLPQSGGDHSEPDNDDVDTDTEDEQAVVTAPLSPSALSLTDEPLLDGWAEYVDITSERAMWFHASTRATTWFRPTASAPPIVKGECMEMW